MRTTKKYYLILFIACFCIFNAQLSASATKKIFASVDPLEGIWKGSSICRVKNSSCHDETVVYYISKVPGSNNYKITANKIVNGVEEGMGDLTCTYNSSKQQIACNKMKDASWNFQINSNTMSGKLYYKNILFRLIKVSKV